MLNKKITILLFFCACFLCKIGNAYDKETLLIKPFIGSTALCMECHNKTEIKYPSYSPARACVSFCGKCHDKLGNHHEVGSKITEKISNNLLLTLKNKIACFTCHDLNNNRFDKSSWKAESLYERIFRNKPQYKTYYLVMKNNDGQLCKQCH